MVVWIKLTKFKFKINMDLWAVQGPSNLRVPHKGKIYSGGGLTVANFRTTFLTPIQCNQAITLNQLK